MVKVGKCTVHWSYWIRKADQNQFTDGFFRDDWTVSWVDGWTPHSQLANPRHGEFWGAHTVAVQQCCFFVFDKTCLATQISCKTEIWLTFPSNNKDVRIQNTEWPKGSQVSREPSEMMWGILEIYYCNYHDSLGCPPSEDATTTKTFHLLARGSRTKPSFAALTGKGDNPNKSSKSLEEDSCTLLFHLWVRRWMGCFRPLCLPWAGLQQRCREHTHTHTNFPWVSEGQESIVYLGIHMFFVVFFSKIALLFVSMLEQ